VQREENVGFGPLRGADGLRAKAFFGPRKNERVRDSVQVNREGGRKSGLDRRKEALFGRI